MPQALTIYNSIFIINQILILVESSPVTLGRVTATIPVFYVCGPWLNAVE